MKTKLLVLCAGLLCSTAAPAAIVVVNQTIDLTAPAFANATFWQFELTGLNVAVAEGDTLQLNIDFLGDQALIATSLTQLWSPLFTGVSSEITQNGTLTFTNPAGPLLPVVNETDVGACCVHIGTAYSPVTSGPGSVSFTGFQSSVLVVDYGEAGVTSRTYTSGALFLSGSGFAVANAIPEPGTWAMMLLGFGAMGMVLRRRSAVGRLPQPA